MKHKNNKKLNEIGAIAGIEGLIFGTLLFVFGTLIVIYAWEIIDAKMAVSAAAREASRAYIEASNSKVATIEASRAAKETMDGHRYPLVSFSITPISGSGFSRCSTVVALASTRVHRLSLPLLGQTTTNTVVSARHSEVIDPYRSGLSGSPSC